MPYLRRDLGLASLVLGSRYRAHTGQFTSQHRCRSCELALGSRYRAQTGPFFTLDPVTGRGYQREGSLGFQHRCRSCELASMSAIARTEDERSESEVASEIGHSQSTERASVTVIALRNPANPPSDTHAL